MKMASVNPVKYPSVKTAAVNLISADGAVCVGCEVTNGEIIPALCASQETQNAFADVKAAGYSAAAGAYMVCDGQKVFYSADGLNFSELSPLDGAEPFIFEQRENGKARLYAAGDEKCVFFGGGAGGLNTFDCGICGGQFKNGRLFGIDKSDNFTLRWSGEGGALDWEESIDGAGWLKLDGAGGRILNLLVYGEKLVAVRENCLSVFSAFGTPENFKVESKNLYVSGVIKNTAAVAGNKLLFFADGGCGGGLFSFNGTKITRISCPIAGQTEQPTCATADGGLYFAGVYAKPLKRRAVLVYNVESGTAYFADFPADVLLAGNGVFAYAQGLACKLENGSENGGEFTFTSGKADFGSAGEKYLKTVQIRCAEGVDTEISNGRTVRGFKDVKNALSADMRGANFTFSVKSRAKITAFKAVAEVLDGI